MMRINLTEGVYVVIVSYGAEGVSVWKRVATVTETRDGRVPKKPKRGEK